MGVQLQSTALQEKITPREALRLFASFYERPAEIESLIKQFDLTQKADAPFETLSGGQKQRLVLALALVNLPQLVFLDEPTAGLDPQARRELHKTIRELKTAGRTIVLTTHYIEEAMQLCDRVAIMHHGRIVAIGTPSELLARTKSPPHLVFTTRVPLASERISALDAVISVTIDGQGWRVATTSLTRTMLALIRMTESEKNELLDLQIHRPTLEDVFLELTGSPLESRTDA